MINTFMADSLRRMIPLWIKQVPPLLSAHCYALCYAASPSISKAAATPRLADQSVLWHFWHSKGQGNGFKLYQSLLNAAHADKQVHYEKRALTPVVFVKTGLFERQ